MSNVFDINRNRKPQGIPAGGQFASHTHGEPQGVSLGRHAAVPAHNIPETLLMGHIQNPALVGDLVWEVKRGAESTDPRYHLGNFVRAIPNVPEHEAETFFLRAMDAHSDGGDIEEICSDAARWDTDAHPGGTISPDYTPPGGKAVPGYGQGTLTTGGKYDGFRPITEIAVDVRKDLKEATLGNYLPKGLTYSVTTEKFSGGQALEVQIRGIVDEDRLDPKETDRWGDPKDRPEARLLTERVKEIVNAYNSSDIDIQSDYFNTMYYGRAEIETDWHRRFREGEAAKRKAKRESKRA